MSFLTVPHEIPSHVARVAMVARWKPVHLGHAAVLESLVDFSDHVSIGIGSSNRYDAANPFTPQETAEMIRLVLAGWTNYAIIEVPDLGDGPRWSTLVRSLFGPQDLFVTANAYVRSLLCDRYRVIHPVHLLPPARRVPIDATMVRHAMAAGKPWEEMVPPTVAAYLEERGLVQRFLREFGAATLNVDAPSAPSSEAPSRSPSSGAPS